MTSRIEYATSGDESAAPLDVAVGSQARFQALARTIRRNYSSMSLALNFVIIVALPPLLALIGVWTFVDLLMRCVLAEANRRNNATRLLTRVDATGSGDNVSQTIASVVGYRESSKGYERALRSLWESGAAIVIAGIDGNQEEDVAMLNVCHKVWNAAQLKTMNLPVSIGKAFLRDATNNRSESIALQEACLFLESQLIEAGVNLKGDRSDLPRAIAFTQPHCDLKEIRLTSWTLALVLRKHFDFEFLWSTDSDTLVPPDTIANMSAILASQPLAAGASAYVRLHNAEDTSVSRMTSLVFALDTYLNRAAAGALGKSEYLHGPASMFRLSALRDVVVPWCRFHYSFDDMSQNCVLNEDIQYSMLLSQRGWQRLYVENASIMTGGPETLRQFLGQRLRWSRGIMLHRVLDAEYILREGPITAWYMIRTAFYDVFVFAWIAYYAMTGQVLFTVSKRDLLVLEVLPLIYNYVRSFATLSETLRIAFLYPLYRITLPFIRTYTLITPLNTAWSLPSASEGGPKNRLWLWLRQEHEGIAFAGWSAILAAAIARAGAGCMFVQGDALYVTIYTFMLIGTSMAAYAMFAR